jgi:diadenosine tetraphosphate (Ap4A) HIT family hydrolase
MSAADSVDQFLERIGSETPVFRSETFVAVHDREPIVSGHLLLVSRIRYPSMADLPPFTWPAFLDALIALGGAYAYFEHGRRGLCIAESADAHAHAHVVPLLDSPTFELGPVQESSDVTAAYEIVPAGSEYLLWGRLDDAVPWRCIIKPTPTPKSVVRLTLRTYYSF